MTLFMELLGDTLVTSIQVASHFMKLLRDTFVGTSRHSCTNPKKFTFLPTVAKFKLHRLPHK